MKLLYTLLLCIYSVAAFCQGADSIEGRIGSFDNIYRKLMPALKYSYDEASQTHNYSHNWDFDQDGTNDEVYFIGTGGAHVYYFLKVVLSSGRVSGEIKFVETDFPLLTATDTSNFNKVQSGFVVARLGKSQSPALIVRLDDQTFYDNKELQRRKLKTKNILIRFEGALAKFDSL